MNLHEYQAKQLLARYKIPIPRGEMTDKTDNAAEIFSRLGIKNGVVKSQIHSGGRGKAGGIKPVNSPAQASAAVKELIGKTLITNQTPPGRGKVVRKILIEESLPVERELYLGMVIDRKHSCPSIIASAEGGMEIEELARKSPAKIITVHLHPHLGLQRYQAQQLAYALNVPNINEGIGLFMNFARLFIENDCSLAEINPLVIPKPQITQIASGSTLVALDAKINLDDRALYRHKDLLEWRDISEEDPIEYEASKHDLSYIGLDGTIGCIVNGAGLAMSTMDLIKLHGGNPANFLDVGGGATAEQVTNAFKLLLSNKNVKAILVNIFGGIMKCDVIAEGIVNAVKEVGLNLPLVVRLEGTNVKLGKEILAKSKLNIVSADTMDEAARRVVRLANSNNQTPNSK
ncbi:MAG: ADP-forming succinate--CoA ligase subunit beta [Planctomycetes bacterium]|nr:ADP-forming succinate--CoA ligase subunit beta [Planctomycetota bacterium]